MATTMKKSEILSAIKEAILEKIDLEALGAIQIDVGTWAIPTGAIGGVEETFAKLSITGGNPIGTDKVPALDAERVQELHEDFLAACDEKTRKAAEKKAAHEKKVAEAAAKKAAKAAEKSEG